MLLLLMGGAGAGVAEATVVMAGKLFTQTGQMQAVNGAAGVPAGTTILGGWAVNSASKPYVENLNASTVPAGSIRLGGVAYHSDGRLYVTTEAAANGDVRLGAYRVRSDGALRVSTAAVDASDVYIGGWAVAQTGEARMSIS
jgi:hypothetical protein